MALVTAADSKYFLPLKNLVGSVKFHDNGTRILVYVRSVKAAECAFDAVFCCSYDIGLNASEAAAVLGWGGVELLPMPLSRLSDQSNHPRRHVLAQPASFAWKGGVQHPVSLIIFSQHCSARVISDALTRHAHVFYMDAGQELRWPLDEIERRLRLSGNFHVAQEGWTSNCTCCGNSFVFTHAGTLQALGIPAALIYGRPMSAGGIQVCCADRVSVPFI
jgi:hypothetical protein